MSRPDAYVRALRFRGLTRFYDPLIATALRESRWKGRLVDQVALTPGLRALDLGCGTGTLTVALARSCPAADVVGLDADPEILVRARTKAAAAGVTAEFVEGRAESPPLPAGSFDCVVSSLMFHHLRTEAKRRALEAARALLRDGGELHIADWGTPHDRLMRVAFVPVQLLDGFGRTADNVHGKLPRLIAEAGYTDVEETSRLRTVAGTLTLIRATAAGARS